ncbi:MAG: hypothetical protein ACRDJO_13515 [Actinomycetota bacterium]
MPGTLGSALIASILLATAGAAGPPATAPPAAPAGWIEDFCSDRDNWDKVEEWTGREIRSRADCQSALRGLRD